MWLKRKLYRLNDTVQILHELFGSQSVKDCITHMNTAHCMFEANNLIITYFGRWFANVLSKYAWNIWAEEKLEMKPNFKKVGILTQVLNMELDWTSSAGIIRQK